MTKPTGKLAFAYQSIARLEAERDALAAELAAIKGQEPVGHVYTMQPCFPGEPKRAHAQLHVALPAGTKLYTLPAAPEGGEV